VRGGVTDFIELHAGRLEWPAFNVADSAITIGALLVIFELIGGARQTAGDRA
jgi:signal peptidase II